MSCSRSLYRGSSLSKEKLNEIKTIKDQFNSKRKIYNFSHLDNLTYLNVAVSDSNITLII